MNSPSALEIRCARLEQHIRDIVTKILYHETNFHRFNQLQVGGEPEGLAETTIRHARWLFYLSATTASGRLFCIEVEIAHDDAWIPFVIITSTNLPEPAQFIVGAAPAPALSHVRHCLLNLIETAESHAGNAVEL